LFHAKLQRPLKILSESLVDVCLKTYTRRYGGYGYDHILRTTVPMMKRIGLTDNEIDHTMVQNPARVLAL
jgi:phosphotriesterase-related protein